MSRWIDVEWLMNFFVDIPNNFTLTIGNLRATVNDAPTINIVTCGECKYYEAKEDWCYWRDEAITADDFCSYGSSSEKPNNCEDLQDWKDRMWAEAIVAEPTISKMEQVDKDINVRSKDEPQTDVYDYKGNGKWERSE